ncbi:MAG: hypothetical protein ABH986_04930 [archaeon]
MGEPSLRCSLVFKNKKGIFDKFAEFFGIVDGKDVYFWIEHLNGKEELKKYVIKPKYVTIVSHILKKPQESSDIKKIYDSLKKNKNLKKYVIEIINEDKSNIGIAKNEKVFYDRNALEAAEKITKEDLKAILSAIKPNQNIYLLFGDEHFEFSLYLERLVPTIHFYYDLGRDIGEALQKNREEILKIIQESIQKIQPDIAYFAREGLTDSEYEYHSDPYYFCLEAVDYTDEKYKAEENLFLKEKNKKIEEIKKVLPKEELFELIKKYSDKTIEQNNNLIVIRDGSKYPYKIANDVYPRYFIRKELRKRGIKLKEGEAEKWFKKGLVIWPERTKEAGLISQEIYDKIKKAKEEVEKEKIKDFETADKRIIEKALTKEELKELGLE